jgi:hypothetical protein
MSGTENAGYPMKSEAEFDRITDGLHDGARALGILRRLLYSGVCDIVEIPGGTPGWAITLDGMCNADLADVALLHRLSDREASDGCDAS